MPMAVGDAHDFDGTLSRDPHTLRKAGGLMSWAASKAVPLHLRLASLPVAVGTP
ncbi:MAG: hypothetical protein ABSG32_13690 [Terriglobia bacterium]